jgi:hypothetical protein
MDSRALQAPSWDQKRNLWIVGESNKNFIEFGNFRASIHA